MNGIDLEGIGFTSKRTRGRLVGRLAAAGIRDQRVLDVLASTPRHIFVDEALAHRAYEDTALPIGHGQTLSQPLTVARMTEALLAGGSVQSVLEVGTGSGYQAAVLARLVERVYTVERLAPLVQRARSRMRLLGLRNVHLRHGDGASGWIDSAPFDAILVTAAPRRVPEELLEQLAVGGRLLVPVGDEGQQHLERWTRTAEGFECERLERVRFVPLLGGVVR